MPKKAKNTKTQGDAKILSAISNFHMEEEADGKELLQEVEESFKASAPLAQLNSYIHQNNERPAAVAPKQKMSLKAEKIDAFSLSEAMEKLAEVKRGLLTSVAIKSINCVGPMPALMTRRIGRYRAQLCLFSQDISAIRSVLRETMPTLQEVKSSASVKWVIDVDAFDL